MGEHEKPNAGPPPDADYGELWSLLTTLPFPHRIVDFPRKMPNSAQPVGRVAMVPLEQQETIEAQAAADINARRITTDPKTKRVVGKDDPITPGYQSIWMNEASVQVLWRACRDVNDRTLKKPAFPTAALMKRHLTADEIGVLMNEYNITRAKCGPFLSQMTAEEQDAWLDALEAGGGAVLPFASLSSDQWIELLSRSVERTQSLRTDSGSRGGPHGGPSSPPTLGDAEAPMPLLLDESEPPAVPE